jgi:hypothetical protein
MDLAKFKKYANIPENEAPPKGTSSARNKLPWLSEQQINDSL